MKKAQSRKVARLRKEQRERMAATQMSEIGDFANRLAEIERRLAFMELLMAPRMPSIPVPYSPMPLPIANPFPMGTGGTPSNVMIFH